MNAMPQERAYGQEIESRIRVRPDTFETGTEIGMVIDMEGGAGPTESFVAGTAVMQREGRKPMAVMLCDGEGQLMGRLMMWPEQALQMASQMEHTAMRVLEGGA